MVDIFKIKRKWAIIDFTAYTNQSNYCVGRVENVHRVYSQTPLHADEYIMFIRFSPTTDKIQLNVSENYLNRIRHNLYDTRDDAIVRLLLHVGRMSDYNKAIEFDYCSVFLLEDTISG